MGVSPTIPLQNPREPAFVLVVLPDLAGAVAHRAVGAQRLEGGSVATAGFCNERPDVGAIGAMQQLRGNGGIVRLVFLPFEAHGYRGKETIEHVLYEKSAWLNKYLKGTTGSSTNN